MLDIKDSVAVITGGASGIGLAVARYWVETGGKTVLADVAREALEKAVDELSGGAVSVPCDVTQEADCSRLAQTAMDTYGKINLVAPFAGSGLVRRSPRGGRRRPGILVAAAAD